MHQSPVPAEAHWTWEQPDGSCLDVAWQGHGDCHDHSEQGTAPSMVLVHGFGASSHHWRHNLPVLGKYTRTYALDLS